MISLHQRSFIKLSESYAQALGLIARLTSHEESLKQELAALTSESKDLQESNRQLQRDISASEEQASAMESLAAKQSAELDEHVKTITTLKKASKKQRATISMLQDDLEDLSARKQEVLDENALLQVRTDELVTLSEVCGSILSYSSTHRSAR